MPTLGQELRKKREERGSSLKDIANQTKIGLRLLQALEDDRHDLLPEMFFLKGVLRSYVKAIGADENYFMDRLTKATAGPALEEEVPAMDEHPERDGKVLRILALVAGLAIVAVAGYFLLRGRPASDRVTAPKPAAELRAVPDDSAAAVPVESKPAPTAEPKTAVPEPPLKLEMAFLYDTWMVVEADGVKVYQDTHKAGETAVFTAQKSLLLWIGNAGGFSFKLNGKPAKSMGGRGVVLTDVRITPETLASFLEPAADGAAGR
jgi:cytoskeleton protein RodZ